MGGCFSGHQTAELTSRTNSLVSGKSGVKNAVQNEMSPVDAFSEATSGASGVRQGLGNGVDSDSIECRSTGLPSIRYNFPNRCVPSQNRSFR